VQHVVYHSAIGASATTALEPGREHFQHEEQLKASGVKGWTIIQPTFFHQNIEKFHLTSIRQHSMFAGSAGDGRFASVDLRDVASAAVAILKHPELHKGKLYTLTGEVTSEPIIATYLTAVLGRPIQYVNWTPEEHRKQLKSFGLPDWLIEDNIVLDMIKREGWAATLLPDLETIVGRKGITVNEYIESIADELKGSK